MSLDIQKIYHAFSPSQEITDPTLFVGRNKEIETGISALHNRGGFLSVFGLRGVGKSSIAYQIKLIAQGDNRLPNMQAKDKLLPKNGFNYHVHYIRCDQFVKNINDLLKRVLFGDDDNPSLFSLTKTGDRKIKELKKSLEATGGGSFLGVKAEAGSTVEKTYDNHVTDDLVQQFRQLLRTVRKDIQSDNDGLLILIDEFDIIEDTSGFASIVKACSSDFVKFGTIGIASSVSELIKDHNSIGRQLDFINVPLMSKLELSSILKKAEYMVNYVITFNDDAVESITSKSEGFPFFTHLLGKEAMLSAFKRGSSEVNKTDIEYLSKLISEGRLNTIYEDLYHSAVKSSEQREILLKAFAEQEDDEVFTESVYSVAKDLGITNPSQLMKELTYSDSGNPVLTKVRERYYRFTDPVFKTYSKMRSWKF